MLDTNLILSYLLPPADPNRVTHQLVATLVTGKCRLVFPDEFLEEMLGVVRTKPYFRERVTEHDAQLVLERLKRGADIPPRLRSIPRIVRDPKDYLLAYAVTAGADFLVTGDRDLLALDGAAAPLRIVTAAAFLQMLEPESGEP